MRVLATAGAFLVSTGGGLVLFALAARLFLQGARVGVFHPLMHMVVKVTDPFVKMMHPFLPQRNRIDLALVVLIFLVELVKLTCIYILNVGMVPSLLALLFMAVAEGGHLLANVCFYAIMAEALLSFIPAMQGSPVMAMLRVVTEPILSPIRRLVSQNSLGLDLSPLVAIILLQLLEIVILNPLVEVAFGLME